MTIAAACRPELTCREHVDRSVALGGRLNSTSPIPGAERLLVESAPDGWWYSVAVPDGSLVAVTLRTRTSVRDRSEMRGASGRPRSSSPNTRASVCSARSSPHPSRSTARNPPFSHRRADRVGSPSATPPGAAIRWLESGFQRPCSRPVPPRAPWMRRVLVTTLVLSAYVEARNHRVNAVLAQLLQAYRQEVRWADRRFWRRRHAYPDRIAPITLLPDALVRLSPSSLQKRPALGIAPQHVATLLTLAPTPRPAASVIQEFTARCPIGVTTALRALQALADVVA